MTSLSPPLKFAETVLRLISVNVGKPKEIGGFNGKRVFSAIYKVPVSGPAKVGKFNVEGDQQGNPAVHGGDEKAVYVYPSEHYKYWAPKYPEMEMPWGTFGENFTTEGILEEDAHEGDTLAIGTAEFAVTKPRFPCYKLGLRFGTQGIVDEFLESERSGFYLKVIREGEVRANDPIRRMKVDPRATSITSMVRAKKASE